MIIYFNKHASPTGNGFYTLLVTLHAILCIIPTPTAVYYGGIIIILEKSALSVYRAERAHTYLLDNIMQGDKLVHIHYTYYYNYTYYR